VAIVPQAFVGIAQANWNRLWSFVHNAKKPVANLAGLAADSKLNIVHKKTLNRDIWISSKWRLVLRKEFFQLKAGF